MHPLGISGPIFKHIIQNFYTMLVYNGCHGNAPEYFLFIPRPPSLEQFAAWS